ncbi:hypothetical protein [Paraburkholderia sp. BCC1886]|uniref:hypothetical protein n=1 Tax=Paraburkholderia sp. BCC1886 TaxID=2562670 RepID=UPI0011835340|nr:hypothetical protein [Paraburkholderia sp. BCC1886]
MTPDLLRLATFWRLLARVRRLRVQRRLREMAQARRAERQAAGAVATHIDALEQHAEARLRVVAACRSDARTRGQWQATLRRHDARLPDLQDQLDDAERAHARAREDAALALANWRRETIRQEEADRRARDCLIGLRGTD